MKTLKIFLTDDKKPVIIRYYTLFELIGEIFAVHKIYEKDYYGHFKWAVSHYKIGKIVYIGIFRKNTMENAAIKILKLGKSGLKKAISYYPVINKI